MRVAIREVGPRDGFQNEPEVVSTADKVRLIELLARSGLKRLEVTSFVRADVIPQLADGAEVLARIDVLLGGRVAEEIVLGDISTGAQNDLQRATEIARTMITQFGMSEKLGPRVLGRNHDQPFLGREMGNDPDYSDEIAREIDDEIRRVIEDLGCEVASPDEAREVLGLKGGDRVAF